MFDVALADEEEDKNVHSMHEAIVELPRSSSTKRRSRQIFKTPPKKKTLTHPQPQTTPTNIAPWLPPTSTQQQQWMMGQLGPWLMGQQFPWMQPQQAPAT